jgi:hypothetical protein
MKFRIVEPITGKTQGGKFSEKIFFARLNIFLITDLSLTNYIQYDNISNVIEYKGRFFWQIRPGNIIYLVYNNNMER